MNILKIKGIVAQRVANPKAMAKEQKKQVWQLINPNAKKFPRLVGNCIGGGKHTNTKTKKPDFQEFLLIPNLKSVEESYKINKPMKCNSSL